MNTEQFLALQREDGSFNLLQTEEAPSDVRHDYIRMPTVRGASLLMKRWLQQPSSDPAQLERALTALCRMGLRGHGYEAERGQIESLQLLIDGGLSKFMVQHRALHPEFCKFIEDKVAQYRDNLARGATRGMWGENYAEEWQAIVGALTQKKILYAAYGSNMNREQMAVRCPSAELVGSGTIEGWELTMPFYANIEPVQGEVTPVIVWALSSEDERALDRYEGFPSAYTKEEITVTLQGMQAQAMVYVMTESYKTLHRTPRADYLESIKQGYREAGFDPDGLNKFNS